MASPEYEEDDEEELLGSAPLGAEPPPCDLESWANAGAASTSTSEQIRARMSLET